MINVRLQKRKTKAELLRGLGLDKTRKQIIPLILYISLYIITISISINILPYNLLDSTVLLGFQVFTGNTDSDSVVTHVLQQPIIARYVQLKPIAWNNNIAMRAEFYGCVISGMDLNL